MTISRSTTSNYNKLANLSLPDPPTSLVAIPGNNSAIINFTTSANLAGGTLVNYHFTSNTGNFIGSGTSSPVTVSGLTNGNSYTFTGVTETTIGNSVISTPSNSVTPSADIAVEYLVVAGGGAGGTNETTSGAGGSGGGGAGGMRTGNLNITPSVNYTVTVGAGGSNANGSNSVFSTITSQGGGKGGNYNVNTGNPGNNGGSGGGGGASVFGATNIAGGTGNSSPQQGYAGGVAKTSGAYPCAGGGGGASQVGFDATYNTAGGNGGDGLVNNITGSNVTYAGGGGGGAWQSGNTNGLGGAGGGGNGQYASAGSNGTTNTGGGGGGGNDSGGGNGGSGIVILKVPNTYTETVANTLTYSTSTVTGFKIFSFTAGTGNVSFA